jgi:hypothetical protein
MNRARRQDREALTPGRHLPAGGRALPLLACWALAGLLMFGVFASAAVAHQGNPDFRSQLTGMHPLTPGVDFQVLNYDADLQLNDHGHTVVLYGYQGEPYARVLPDGTVQVNQRSPAAYLNEDRYAETPVPASANPKAPPAWKTTGERGVFIWHDHRMHWMSRSTPPQVKDQSRRTKIFDYRIPMSVDGKPANLDGTLYWVGPADTSKAPFLIIGAVIVLGLLATVIVVRRRRASPKPQPDGEEAKEAW